MNVTVKGAVEFFGSEWTYRITENGKEIAFGYGFDLESVEGKEVVACKVDNQGDVESQVIILYVK